ARHWRAAPATGPERLYRSLQRAPAFYGGPGLLHDVALKRFTESFCNTFARCGACCRRCSEPCPSRTCNICNTLSRCRRRTYATPTCAFPQDAAYARFAPPENCSSPGVVSVLRDVA